MEDVSDVEADNTTIVKSATPTTTTAQAQPTPSQMGKVGPQVLDLEDIEVSCVVFVIILVG